MKNIHVTLDDEDFKKLAKVKGNNSWREFMLSQIKK